MKTFLAPRVRKSVPGKLALAKSDFLDLVEFFDFASVDKFLLLPPILPPPLTLLALLLSSCYRSYSLSLILRKSFLVAKSVV